MMITGTRKLSSAYHLFKKAFGTYTWQILTLTGLGLVSGIMEGIGVNAIIPLFSLLSTDMPPGADFISKGIQALFAALHINFTVTSLLLFIAVLFIGKAAALLYANYLNAKISYQYEYDLRSEVFEETLHTTWPYLLTQKVGHLEKVLMDHVSNAANALLLVSTSILTLTSLCMYVIVALNISLEITLLTLSTGAFLFLVFKPLLYRTRMASHRLANIGKQVAHHINETNIGAKIIKSLRAEESVLARGKKYFEELMRARVLLALVNGFTNVLYQPISIIFVLIVFAFARNTPGFSFASFAVILYLIQKIFSYVQSVQGKLNSISEYAPYIRSVIDYKEQAAKHHEKDDGEKSFNLNVSLDFKNVSFAYDEKNIKILKDLSFSMQKGHMVGLIGPSGAGKTTIVDLLLRLLVPSKGAITLDGEPIERIAMKSWRENVGYVSQDIFLLNDTIQNNITFHLPRVNQKDVEEAARQANIHEYIMSLRDGYETQVGERGVMLSVGQRQRVVLARALLRKPKILILDEATSALDNESEALVQQSIDSLKGNISIIMIAHRLSTLKNCDWLLVLDEGKIIEEGTPVRLLGKKSSYFYKVNHIIQ